MPDSVSTVGGFKSSGQSLDDYLKAQRSVDAPPGVSPYSAGMAGGAYAGEKTQTPMDRLSSLMSKAKEGLSNILGLGGTTNPAASAPTSPVIPRTNVVQVGNVLANRTPALENQLNALERRSTTIPPTAETTVMSPIAKMPIPDLAPKPFIPTPAEIMAARKMAKK